MLQVDQTSKHRRSFLDPSRDRSPYSSLLQRTQIIRHVAELCPQRNVGYGFLTTAPNAVVEPIHP
jgi:putative SOS response-associated peptidase YedK